MRWIAYARKAFFPLLALAGLALLAFGYFEWRRFYADLYLEEMRALGAAVDLGATVQYRRAGETKNRVAGDPDRPFLSRHDLTDWIENRSRAPVNAPFLGRVEAIWIEQHSMSLTFPPFSPEVGRDLLSLPGLKSFDGKFGPASGNDVRPEEVVGFELPELPRATLTKEELLAPLPHGEPLDDATRIAFAARIAEAWARPTLSTTHVLRTEFRADDVHEGAFRVVQANDGDRFSVYVGPNGRPEIRRPAYVGFYAMTTYDGVRFNLLNPEAGGWRRTASHEPVALNDYQRESFTPWLPAPGAPVGFYGDGRSIDRHQSWTREDWPDSLELLGPAGENVATLERIDDARLRIVLAPHRSTMSRGYRGFDGKQFVPRTIDVEAVVREDLNFAVEDSRIVAAIDDVPEGYERKRFLSAKRRLAVVDGFVYSEECLESRLDHLIEPNKAPEPDFAKAQVDRTSAAVLVVPTLPDRVFDPLSYDPTPWPEPRPLPLWRSYRVAGVAGGALLLAGTIGALASRRTARRATRSAKSAAVGRAQRRPRLPRLRFGLTTLFAAALLLISAAGAVKEKRDEAQRDAALLGRVRGSYEVDRAEPRFPWSLFSTPSLPLDAPIRRILIDAHWLDADVELSEADVEALLRHPGLESLRYLRSNERDEPDDAFAFASDALGRPLPELIETWKDPNEQEAEGPRGIPSPFFFPHSSPPWDPPALATGTALKDAEREPYLGELLASWRESRAAFPRRYLLAAQPAKFGQHVGATLRDGERFWTAADSTDADEPFVVRCQDERYRYAFLPTAEGALLVERTRLGSEPLRSGDERYWAPSLGHLMTDPMETIFDPPPERAPDPPFAFPVLLDGAPFPERLADALLDPAKVREVSRVDAKRHRIDFEPTTVAFGDDGIERIAVSDLAVVVRDDFGGAAESVEFVREVVLLPEEKREPETRRFRIENRLMRSPEGVVVPYRTIVYDSVNPDDWSEKTDSKFAYDFAPQFDERIFSSPSMSELDPLPEPQPPRTFAWWMATGVAALGLFAFAGVGRLRETLGRRSSGSEEEGTLSEATS